MILDNEFNGDIRVQNEVLALLKDGHEVFVLCLNFGGYSKVSNFKTATIVRINISKFFKNKLKFVSNSIFDLYSFWWKFKIRKFVTDYRINIIHAHDLYMAQPVISANKKFMLPTILDLHEDYPSAVKSYSWANSLLGKIFVSHKRWLKREKKYLANFQKLVVLSDDFKKVLRDKYDNLTEDQFITFPNYPNIDEWQNYTIQKNILKKEKDFIIFYFGVIGVRRGIFTLINSLLELKNEYSNIKLLLIGPVDKADQTKFNKYINLPQIKKRIIYYPWKEIDVIPSYISLSDICVSPLIKNDQHESGIANKVFQYMLFEKPLIVSNCIPQQKVVEDEKCGLVFKSDDIADLSEKIKILFRDEKLRKEMGDRGKKAVLGKYNLKVSSENLIEHYRKING